jgi:hypothetical protein
VKKYRRSGFLDDLGARSMFLFAKQIELNCHLAWAYKRKAFLPYVSYAVLLWTYLLAMQSIVVAA